MSTKIWLRSLIHAIVAGAANSLAAIVADPNVFNFTSYAGLSKLGFMALTGGIVGLIYFLKQSPVPGESSGATSGEASK